MKPLIFAISLLGMGVAAVSAQTVPSLEALSPDLPDLIRVGDDQLKIAIAAQQKENKGKACKAVSKAMKAYETAEAIADKLIADKTSSEATVAAARALRRELDAKESQVQTVAVLSQCPV